MQKHNACSEEELFMRCHGIILLLVVIACMVIAGCTQSSGTGPVTTAVPVTSLPAADPVTPAPVVAEPADPPSEPAATPVQVVTIVHLVSNVKDVKDSELMFALQIPEEWSISTRRLNNPENFEGSMFRTDLVENNTFYIDTFSDYREREQNYGDEFRAWSPAPAMTTAKINGIVFDRFESTANGKTRVGYVPRKGSTNEQGYLSVIAFTANTSNRFEKEDYDKIVSSFQYFSRSSDVPVPGEEIYKVPPPEEESGGTKSAVNTGGSSGGGSSGGSSSGGSHCARR
jgi:uncharacterized membrane protein YgcG